MHNAQQSSTQATYEIKVGGVLDAGWAEWFSGVMLTTEETGDGSRVTTLTGSIDQSALHGILARIRDLHLKLISVAVVEQGESGSHSQRGGS